VFEWNVALNHIVFSPWAMSAKSNFSVDDSDSDLAKKQSTQRSIFYFAATQASGFGSYVHHATSGGFWLHVGVVCGPLVLVLIMLKNLQVQAPSSKSKSQVEVESRGCLIMVFNAASRGFWSF
jgi:hypothetical protein